MTERIQMTLAEFKAKGKELYGDNYIDWKFECPSCHHPQSAKDWEDNKIDKDTIQNQLGFSCIGRHVENIGCDWTLGGLFQIHTLEVIDDDGEVYRHFKLYEPKEKTDDEHKD